MQRYLWMSLICLFSLSGTSSAYYLDAPHNEANGMQCSTCHSNPVWSTTFVPQNIDDTQWNTVCNGCHGVGGSDVHGGLHSDLVINATQNWTTQCLDCHDPHFQDQFRAYGNAYPQVYLVDAQLVSGSAIVYNGDGTTTIQYTTISLPFSPWNDPATWGAKGGYSDGSVANDGSRGLAFTTVDPVDTELYEVISATGAINGATGQLEGTINLKGQTTYQGDVGILANAHFGLVYGQLIKSTMDNTDTHGNGVRNVKFFSPIANPNGPGGFSDNTPGTTNPEGICQVCHPSTLSHWNTDNSGDGPASHHAAENCATCHVHTDGFKSPPMPNVAPVADAGPDQQVWINETVTLDGTGSSDADNDTLTYTWTITAKPAGSAATLIGPTTASPTFTTDLYGRYTIELTVNDGEFSSPPDTVTISNTAPEDVDLGLGYNEQQGGGGLVGEMVRLLNGNMIETRSDLSIASPNSFGLSLSAVYNSRSNIKGVMGHGWRHSYEAELHTNITIGSHSLIKIIDPTGRASYFEYDTAAGYYKGVFGEKTWLTDDTQAGGYYLWNQANGAIIAFDAAGYLAYLEDERGNRINIDQTNGVVNSVTDSVTGRTIYFHYNADNMLATVTGPVTDAIAADPGNPGFSLPWATYTYDADNNLTSVLYQDGDQTLSTPPFASGVVYEYTDTNDPNNLTARKDTLGNTSATWGYDAKDRCVANYSVGGSGAALIDYDSTYPIIKVTDAYNISRDYTVDASRFRKRLIYMATVNGPAPYGGDIVRWVYDDNLNLTETETLGGVITQYSGFDANGNPATVITGVGAMDQTNTISFTRTIHNEYHPQISAVTRSWETSMVNPSGIKETIYDYDNPADDPDPATANSKPTRLVYSVTEKGYTVSLTGAVIPYAQTTTYQYTALGLISKINGPRTDVTDEVVYAYYAAEPYNLETITRPLVGSTKYLNYDNDGRPRQIQDENGKISSSVVDGRGRTLSATSNVGLADETTRSMEYSGGQLMKQTDAAGVVTTYEYYPGSGRLYRVYDMAGNYKENKYDSQGNIIEIAKYAATDPANPTYIRYYDYTGHPVMKGSLYRITKSNGLFAEYDYYADGSEKSYTDYDGRKTSYTYDDLGRRVRTDYPQDPDNPAAANFSATGYDLYGNVSWYEKSLDGTDKTSSFFSHDDAGRLLSDDSPDRGSLNYAYDSANGTISKQEAGGITRIYKSDVLDRLVMIDLPGTVDDIVYNYDEGGLAANALGRQTSVVDANQTTTYTYDTKGRAVTKSVYIAALDKTYDYTRVFTDDDRLDYIVYPTGPGDTTARTINFGYNSRQQIVSIATAHNNVTETIFANIAYKPFGGVESMDTSASSVINQSGDCGCGVTTSNPGAATELVYSYYDNNNLQSLTYTYLPWKNESYQYNEMGRLTQVSKGAGVFTFTYDQAGNRLSRNAVGAGVFDNGAVWIRTSVDDSLHYLPGSSKLEQIDRTISKGGAATSLQLKYSYSANGNIDSIITTDLNNATTSTRSFQHDNLNRLTAVLDDGATVGSYTYNAYNQRISKTVNGVTTYYLYDFNGSLIAELNSDGTIAVEYIYSGGQIIARVDNQTDLYYYHNDRNGTPQMVSKVVNGAHVAIWDATYLPYGEALVNNNSEIVNNLRFPGQYYDAETGLHYNYHRYYNPQTGRYITADPIGLQGGVNMFNYAGGDPVNGVDRLGLKVFEMTIGVGGGVGYVIVGGGVYNVRISDLACDRKSTLYTMKVIGIGVGLPTFRTISRDVKFNEDDSKTSDSFDGYGYIGGASAEVGFGVKVGGGIKIPNGPFIPGSMIGWDGGGFDIGVSHSLSHWSH